MIHRHVAAVPDAAAVRKDLARRGLLRREDAQGGGEGSYAVARSGVRDALDGVRTAAGTV